jgi:hypothetical protein
MKFWELRAWMLAVLFRDPTTARFYPRRQAKQMPMLFSPTIGAAITAGYWFLQARCPACRTTGDVDLRTLDWHRGAASALIPALSCRSCRPKAPFAELVCQSKSSVAEDCGAHRQQVGQRALIQSGRAAEKRRANADDGAMAFSGGVGGANAPIKKAARTPSSKPKIILRAFGRTTGARPQSTPAAARDGCDGRARIVDTLGSVRINNVTVAQTQST